MILNYCRISVVYNIQNGSNEIKLLMVYESVIQKVLLFIESILQNAKQFQHAQFYFVVSGLKIIGQGNNDNNLESHCTFQYIKLNYGAQFVNK
jgi:hypothetical protein